MSAKIIGHCLRTRDLKRMAAFYEAIGISFAEDVSVTGSSHLVTATPPRTLLEIYTTKVPEFVDDGIIIEVTSIKAVLQSLKKVGLLNQRELPKSDVNQAVGIFDPDGRPVFLILAKNSKKKKG
jgi:hypothetical protein